MDDGSKYSFDQGDIVLCREISRDYWKTKLHIKQWNAFVIVHQSEGILIKQIIDHDCTSDHGIRANPDSQFFHFLFVSVDHGF